jgi:hypothetical protein
MGAPAQGGFLTRPISLPSVSGLCAWPDGAERAGHTRKRDDVGGEIGRFSTILCLSP